MKARLAQNVLAKYWWDVSGNVSTRAAASGFKVSLALQVTADFSNCFAELGLVKCLER